MEWIGPLVIGIFVACFVFQIVWSVSLSVIARKGGESDLIQILAWIPLLQIVPMVLAGGGSVGAFLLGALALFVGAIALGMAAAFLGSGLGGSLTTLSEVLILLLCFGYAARLFWNTAIERDLPGWVGLLLLIPGINFFAFPYIAFHDGWEMPQKGGLVIGLLITFATFAPPYRMLQAIQSNGGFPTDEAGWAALAEDPQWNALTGQMTEQDGFGSGAGFSLPSAADFASEPSGNTPNTAEMQAEPNSIQALLGLQGRFQALERATSGSKLNDPNQRQAASAILQTTQVELETSREALGEETYQELLTHLLEIEAMLGGDGSPSRFSAAPHPRSSSSRESAPAAIAHANNPAPALPLPVEVGADCAPGTELKSQTRDGQDEEWCEQTASSGGLRHGWYAKYAESGQPVSVGEYRDGLRVGVWTRFYPNGSVRMQAEFAEGLQHGWLLSFNEAGQRIKAVRFADGTALP
ncbi:MAG: hypothetical protein AB8G23_09585 [Myxococcota bacterium]